MESVGVRIKKTRLEKGLSQAELAAAAAVSQPTVANWETGSHTPRQAALARIAVILDTSAPWLLSGDIYENGQDAVPNTYLATPIRHVPLRAWPDQNDIQISTDGPTLTPSTALDYIAVSTRENELFATIAKEDQGRIHAGSIIILSGRVHALKPGKSYLFAANVEAVIRLWDKQHTDCNELSPHQRPIARAVQTISKL